MQQFKAQLVERRMVGAGQELCLAAPALAQALQAGQPLLLRSSWGLDPYLRRAYYPIALEAETCWLRLPPSGDRGHAWLRLAALGTELDCLGGVGRGFHLPEHARNLLYLGEGELAWTLLPALHQAAAQGRAVTLALEASSGRHAIPAQRLPLAAEYRLATIDGSRGRKGRLTALFPDLLSWCDAVIAAGSLPFYQRLAEAIREQRILLSRDFAQALYPTTFLCGTGACLACVADIAGGRRRVCLRGPVFDLVDIFR